MACGRPKNLEIGARNLLCSPADGRRNFLTTRDGNRRRGTPSHPAKDNSWLSGKEKSGATGKEETPSHRCGGNPGPPGVGQTLGPLALGKARCHPARGKPARRNLEPPAQGKLQSMWRRGNPESCAEKKALGRRRRENFKLCDGGETPSCVMRRKL